MEKKPVKKPDQILEDLVWSISVKHRKDLTKLYLQGYEDGMSRSIEMLKEKKE